VSIRCNAIFVFIYRYYIGVLIASVTSSKPSDRSHMLLSAPFILQKLSSELKKKKKTAAAA